MPLLAWTSGPPGCGALSAAGIVAVVLAPAGMLVATLTAQAMADAVRAAVTRNRFERIPTPLDTVRPHPVPFVVFRQGRTSGFITIGPLAAKIHHGVRHADVHGVITGTHSRSGL